MATERRYALLGHQHSLTNLDDWGLLSASGNRWGVLASVNNTDGVMEVGRYIDFHETDADTDDYDFRFAVTSGLLAMSGDFSSGKGLFTANSDQVTIVDANGADAADKAKFELDGGYASIYAYDNSATKWRRPLTSDVSTGDTSINTDANSRHTYIGNYNSGTGAVKVYAPDGNPADFVTNYASSSYIRLYYNTSSLGCYLFTDTASYGLLGSDGAYDLQIGRSTNQADFSGSVTIPSGAGYFVDGANGDDYIAYNTTSSYTNIKISGSKGSYSGFYAVHSGMAYMWDASGNGGPYRETDATWHYYHVSADDCTVFGGTGSDSTYKIYVYGSAYATGTWSASDERKKRDIKTIPYALDRVCAMRGVEYRWREDADIGQDPERYHVGLIAQEVEKVVPEAVNYATKTDAYAVDYSGLVGLLVQAVKELREELNEFKKERSR